MSNFQKGPWCEILDALYWRFINKHRDFFKTNYRMAMMVKLYDKKTEIEKEKIKTNSEEFLNKVTETKNK